MSGAIAIKHSNGASPLLPDSPRDVFWTGCDDFQTQIAAVQLLQIK